MSKWQQIRIAIDWNKKFNFYDVKSISICLKMVNAGKSAVKILQYINAPIIKFVLKQYNFE